MLIILVIGFAGWQLDEWLHMNFPVFLVIGLIGGVVLSMYSVIKDLLK